MTVDEIADEIYRELDFPSDLTRADISYWLGSNLSKLNIFLQSDYNLNLDEVTFETALPLEVKDIFKQIYIVGYYDLRIVQSLVLAEDGFLEITSDDSSLSFSDATSNTRAFIYEKRNALDRLKQMVFKYKSSHGNLPYNLNLVPIGEEDFSVALVENGWLLSRSTSTSE